MVAAFVEAFAEGVERAFAFDDGADAFEDAGGGVRAQEGPERFPLFRLAGLEEAEDGGGDEAEVAVVVVGLGGEVAAGVVRVEEVGLEGGFEGGF